MHFCFEFYSKRCDHLIESEQRERLMSTSRQDLLVQGVSALVRLEFVSCMLGEWLRKNSVDIFTFQRLVAS